MKKFQHFWSAAAAFGLAATAQAGFFAGSTDFESATTAGLQTDTLWSNVGDAKIDDTDASVSSAPSRPSNYKYASTRNKVLAVDNDTPIIRNLQSNSVPAAVGDGIYADVLLKGTALANGADAPAASAGDKLLVYFRVNQAGTATNLCVLATDSNGATNEVAFTNTSVGKDEWHRVVIAAKAGNAYQFYFDGDTLCTAGATDTVYALTSGDTVSSIGFKGTGSVDDLVLSTWQPSLPISTLEWDTSFASVSYVVGNTTNALNAADGSCEFQAPSGSAVTLIGDTGYRTVTATGTASSSPLTLEVNAPTGLAWYSADVSGAGTSADPYTIPTYGALVAMQQAVAADAAFRSAYYKQTADIDCTGEAAFAGVGTYNASPTSGTAFTGTYDGQGYKIKNIDFTQRNYGGVFNQVNGGTIKNVTVSNITCSTYSASVNDSEFGFAIVGNAGNGATLTNIVAEGVFASASQPATHNIAGIVVRASAGGTGTLVKDCVNNATLYGAYTKAAGICALTQVKVAGGAVTFDGCVNNGAIALDESKVVDASKHAGQDGVAGIISYIDDDTVLKDCSNTGTLSSTYASAKIGQLVGWAYTKDASNIRSLTDQGGNSAAKTDKMLASRSALATVTGFQYATVDNNDVATTIAPPYTLVKDTTYLLEGNAAPMIELDDGDTVAFDTALGYTLNDTGITAAEGLAVTTSTVGTVTTFTTAVARYVITWTDHGGTVKTETLDYGATPTAPATAPVQYVENGKIYTGVWPTPANVTGTATYAAVYTEGDSAVATVITIADAGATTNVFGYYASLKAAVEAAPAGATVVLLADDAVSFAGVQVDADRIPSNGSIVIDKNLVIDGDGHTVTGVSNAEILNATGSATPGYDMVADLVNGSNLLGFFVKSGDVTFKNIALTEFGDTAYVNKFGYTPIQTASAYAGDLVLENVDIDKFNRTAVCVRGGTLTMVGGTVTANAAHKTDDHFQQPIEVRGGTAMIDGVTVENDFAYANGGGAIVAWSDTTLTNVVVDFTGVGVWADYEDIAIVGENTSIEATDKALFVEDAGSITVSDGDFAGSLAVDAVAGSSITVNGGTFDAPVPAEFAGAGLAPTTVADNDGKFTVKTARTVAFTVAGASYTNIVVATGEAVARPADPVDDAYAFTGWTLDGSAYDFATPVTADIELEATITSLAAATWIGGASGNWNVAANWDLGYVPTKATVVTFTNDAQVAISNTDACKGMVLDNAAVSLVRASGVGAPILRFYGNGDSAVSVASGKTGSLAVNDITLFNERVNYTDLTIGSAFEVKGDVSFRGISIVDGSRSASFTITGKTTVSANASVKTIDYGTTKFQGGVEVAKGVTAKFTTNPKGGAKLGTGVTLVANDGAGSPTAIWLMQVYNKALLDGASVSVDADHAAAYYVKKRSAKETGTYGGDCEVYEALPKPTVTVTATGVTVTGVTDGQKVVPGTALTIGTTVAEGYEPSVTITKTADSTVLLTTNAVSFAYTMPDFDITVAAEAVAIPAAEPDPVDPGSSMTAEQMAAYPPVQVSGTDFKVHFVGQEGVTYVLVAAGSCDLTEEQWKGNAESGNAAPVGQAKTTADANADGVIELSAPMGEASAQFYKIKAYIAE